MKPFSIRTFTLTISVSIFSLFGIYAAHWLGNPTFTSTPFIVRMLADRTATARPQAAIKAVHPAPSPQVSPTGDPGDFDIEEKLDADTLNANTSDGTPGVAGTGVGVLNAAGAPGDWLSNFAIPTAVVTGSATICVGGSATIQAALTGTGPWDVTWSDGVTQMGVAASPATRTVSPATTTIYTVTSVMDATATSAVGTGSAVITVNDPPTPSNAGPDQTICLGAVATLAANTPTVGTGLWSVMAGPSTDAAQFNNTSSPTATFTPAGGAGLYRLRWRITNAPCPASANIVQIFVNDPPTTAMAGPDQPLCTTTPATLAANPPTIGIGGWSLVSGPSTLLSQFSSAAAPNATFTPAGGAGAYTLRWTISNGVCDLSFDDVVLNYSAPPTLASAGPDETLCTTTPAILAANVPTIGTGFWSVVTGPSTDAAQFSSVSSPTATFTPAGGEGTYILRWTITNAPCTATTDEVELTYTPPPTTANAGPDQVICPFGPATLAANTPTIGTGAWSVVSGPSTLLSQFSSISAPNATFTPAGGAGTYRLRWRISNPICASANAVNIIVGNSVTVDAGPDQSVPACATNIKLAGTIGGVATAAIWSGGAGTFTPNATNLTATYTPTPAEIAAGSVTLTLTTNDPPGTCDLASDQVTITFTPCADLSLEKKVDNPTPTPGQNVVFTLTLTNAGPSTATNVTVTDVLPIGLTFVSANPAASYSSATGIWTVGTVTSGTSATLQITVTVTQVGDITNIAEVTTSDQPDPDSTPNNHVPSEDDQGQVTLGLLSCPKSEAGSILVFPYYTSSMGSDTRMTISHVKLSSSTAMTYVHLFFMDGKSCAPADYFVCLTPNASYTFRAMEYDPFMTGYVIAVAVNKDGIPIANNVLIGNAFVKNGEGATDNYTAEKFSACSNPVVMPNLNNTAELKFDGMVYEKVPSSFAIEVQSPNDAQQTLVTVGLNGDLTESSLNGAAQVGVGQVINGEEKPSSSFSSWHLGGCQAITPLTGISPRVLKGMVALIPTGEVGTIRMDVGASVGLLFSANSSKGWNGIRGLHATRKTNTATLKIPLFPPDC